MTARTRRSLLYVPGNNPGMLQTGGLFGADVVVLDLEDSVAPSEKDAARDLVCGALRRVDFGRAATCVRLNSLDTFAAADLKSLVPARPDLVLLPKTGCPGDVLELVGILESLESLEKKDRKPIGVMALIESPRGLAEINAIAASHPRLEALVLGAEDYAAMVGALRTKEGAEIALARSQLVNAAAAYGLESFDAVFTDAADDEGLAADTILARNLGFTGKSAVNPRQVKVINDLFSPSGEDVDWAGRVVRALRQAEKEGSGVASIGGKMVDAPVARRAERILRLAEKLGPGGGDGR